MSFTEEIVLFRHLAGSKLYGTDTPESDTDYKEIYIPSARNILLGNTQSAGQSSTGSSKGKNTSDDEDVTRMSIQKFLMLCAKGDVGCIETLFADSNPAAVIVQHDLWDEIVNKRTSLIGRQMKSSFGYIRSQTNRFVVRGDRKSNVDNIVSILSQYKKGERLNKAVPRISETIDKFVFTSFEEGGRNDTYLNVCERKFPVNGKIGDALEIYKKLQDEYGNRTKAAQNLGGADLKGIAHSLRISSEMIQLMSEGFITFPVEQAEYFKRIRLGAIDINEVGESLDNNLKAMEDMSKSYVEGSSSINIESIVIEFHKKALLNAGIF